MVIFIGNLSTHTTEKQVQTLFEEFGTVKSVKIILDNYTRHSRGFGYVEMNEDTQAQTAISRLNNTDFNLKSIVVNEARTRNNAFRPAVNR